eukprot:763561-Hanusia_phi.AAC.2
MTSALPPSVTSSQQPSDRQLQLETDELISAIAPPVTSNMGRSRALDPQEMSVLPVHAEGARQVGRAQGDVIAHVDEGGGVEDGERVGGLEGEVVGQTALQVNSCGQPKEEDVVFQPVDCRTLQRLSQQHQLFTCAGEVRASAVDEQVAAHSLYHKERSVCREASRAAC